MSGNPRENDKEKKKPFFLKSHKFLPRDAPFIIFLRSVLILVECNMLRFKHSYYYKRKWTALKNAWAFLRRKKASLSRPHMGMLDDHGICWMIRSI